MRRSDERRRRRLGAAVRIAVFLALAPIARGAAAQVPVRDGEVYSGAPPAVPALIAPPDGATGTPIAPTLAVSLSDPEGDPLTVTFYGRNTSTISPDFTIIPIPDTQFYVSSLFGGTPAHFDAQTQWVVDQRGLLNIVYLCQLGDCVQDGDVVQDEWREADDALSLIENPQTTGLPEGVPYGVAVGNHDQSPWGFPTGTTEYFNQYFGEDRFIGRAYYGGHYGSNNDNNYQLFEAGGLTFIAISFEYDSAPDQPVLDWADALLAAHRTRRGIVYAHYLIETGNPAPWGAQGLATYNALKDNPNLFLMLCGHVSGEGQRLDVFGSDSVFTLLSDFQSRANGGNGWMRIMEFSPAMNQIQVKTYSPTLGQYETDANSQFTLHYDMTGDDFQPLGAPMMIASGASALASAVTTASFVWAGRAPYTTYEWFATVSDGTSTVAGPTWRFTTGDFLTGVPSGEAAAGVTPDGFALLSVRPNPTRGAAQVAYTIGRPGPVTLSVFDVEGRRIRMLTGSAAGAGPHVILWDGRASDGASAPPGVYVLRIATAGAGRSARVVLLK